MSPSVEDAKTGSCGCGRSPTGQCIGWHGLSEEQLSEAREKWFKENSSSTDSEGGDTD